MYNSYWLARSGTWRREAGAQPSCVLALGFLAVACAKGPATQPDADSLVEWLMVSQTAQAIGAAALNQSWLSEAPAQIADLRAVMAATDTEGIAELEETLGPVAGDTRLLLAALRQRRPGSTRGDLAHWVAVATVDVLGSEPDLGRMPDNDQWDCEYLANIMDLRAIANRGTLANVSRPAMLELEPPPATSCSSRCTGIYGSAREPPIRHCPCSRHQRRGPRSCSRSPGRSISRRRRSWRPTSTVSSCAVRAWRRLVWST